jgi:hypothetical protein
MPSAITNPPNTNYDFGYAFNYALWTEGTNVTLVNVPWNNDYRDIVKFATRTALNNYLNGIENAGVVITTMSYIKPNTPIRINLPFNSVYKYNYLRATNPLQPISGDVVKEYYYFINDVRYVAPNTTELVIQLDVWQTFGFDVTFGQCYIDRGHIGIANSKSFQNYGRDYLTVPESIDTGKEYVMVQKKSSIVMGRGYDSSTQQNYGGLDVLIVATADLTADAGTAAAPILTSSKGGQFFGLPSGADYWVFGGNGRYYWGAADLSNYLQTMQAKPWVTQGIISVTAIPRLVRYQTDFAYAAPGVPNVPPAAALPPITYAMMPNWRNSPAMVSYIPARYRVLNKFLTYPYCVVELTMFTATPIVLKPESWADDNGQVVERFNPIPPNQRVTVSPFKYNAQVGAPTDDLIPGSAPPLNPEIGGDDNGEWVELSTQMNNFPSMAIVNNGAISYLAANVHGIAFQNQSAGWQEQRALNSNNVSYDQATQGMNLANQLTSIGNTRDITSTDISNNLALGQAVVGGVANALNGGVGGGAQGAAMGVANGIAGGVSAGLGMAANSQQLAARLVANNQSNQASVNTQSYMRDTNKGLADYSARGDFENSIAGINAKVQDANLIQPTTSGQLGGEALNITQNNAFVSMRVKMLDHANMRIVGEYWLRYGYAVHQFVTPPANMMVMAKFTYWKMLETYISASTVPEGMKQIIRGIFEKGVTVWADPTYIGTTDLADNTPLTGISLP